MDPQVELLVLKGKVLTTIGLAQVAPREGGAAAVISNW